MICGRVSMLSYYYVKPKDRLYVYDYESGFYKSFDRIKKEWVTPICSFMQVEHDNDIDFVEISRDAAIKIANGVTVDEEYKAFLIKIGYKK